MLLRAVVLSEGLIFLLVVGFSECVRVVDGEARAERTTDSEGRRSETSLFAENAFVLIRNSAGKKESSRSLLAAGTQPGLPSLTVLQTDLVVKLRVTLRHVAEYPFQTPNSATVWCGHTIRDVVLDPVDLILYYVLREECERQTGVESTVTHGRVSYRKAALWNISADGLVKEEVISYWWNASVPEGPAASAPIFVLDPETNSSMDMVMANGMDLSPSRSHLVAGVRMPREKSDLVLLSVADGSRLAFPSKADALGSLAFSPDKSHLYTVDRYEPTIRLESAAVAAGPDGLPLSAATSFELEASFTQNGNPNITDMTFGSQSFAPDGSCLYFLDSAFRRVWALDLSSTPKTPILVAGTDEAGIQDGDPSMAKFEYPRELAVTSDGCNLFVSERSGFLRWIELEQPCGRARSVHTVVRYGPGGFRGLALRSNGTQLYVYLGSNDGHLFEVEIKQDLLPVCGPLPSSSSSQPSPLSSESPPSSSHSFPSSTATPSSSYSPLSTSSSSASSPSSTRPSSSGSSGGRMVLLVVLPIVSVSVVALVAGVLFVVCRRRREDGVTQSSARSQAYKGQQQPFSTGSNTEVPVSSSAGVLQSGEDSLIFPPHRRADDGLHPTAVRPFPLRDLEQCTKNFDSSYRIGEKGAFGAVYWGHIGGADLAIKVMDGRLTESGRRQFVAEVNTLSRLHHGNLIELVGYCDEGSKSILVYPFFPGSSLHARLHNRQTIRAQAPVPPLTLLERVSVALQIAEALRYLHFGANPAVIHRDVKSSNVLLSGGAGDNLRAVLADFGLATIVEKVFQTKVDVTVQTFHISGTHGYMAPELLNGRLSVKSDVYAFGVVVLELLTGKRAIVPGSEPGSESYQLVFWVKHAYNDTRLDLVRSVLDPSLLPEVGRSDALMNSMMKAISLAMECCLEDDKSRPTMTSVLDRMTTIVSDQTVEHIKKSQEAMIASENKRRRQSIFQVGERVWVKATRMQGQQPMTLLHTRKLKELTDKRVSEEERKDAAAVTIQSFARRFLSAKRTSRMRQLLQVRRNSAASEIAIADIGGMWRAPSVFQWEREKAKKMRKRHSDPDISLQSASRFDREAGRRRSTGNVASTIAEQIPEVESPPSSAVGGGSKSRSPNLMVIGHHAAAMMEFSASQKTLEGDEKTEQTISIVEHRTKEWVPRDVLSSASSGGSQPPEHGPDGKDPLQSIGLDTSKHREGSVSASLVEGQSSAPPDVSWTRASKTEGHPASPFEQGAAFLDQFSPSSSPSSPGSIKRDVPIHYYDDDDEATSEGGGRMTQISTGTAIRGPEDQGVLTAIDDVVSSAAEISRFGDGDTAAIKMPPPPSATEIPVTELPSDTGNTVAAGTPVSPATDIQTAGVLPAAGNNPPAEVAPLETAQPQPIRPQRASLSKVENAAIQIQAHMRGHLARKRTSKFLQVAKAKRKSQAAILDTAGAEARDVEMTPKEPVPDLVPEPVVKVVPGEVQEPVAELAPQPVPQPVPQLVAQPAQSAPQEVPEMVQKHVPESVPSEQPAQEPVPNAIKQEIPEPAPQPVPEPVVEQVSEPIPAAAAVAEPGADTTATAVPKRDGEPTVTTDAIDASKRKNSQHAAATLIQKHVRGYMTRKKSFMAPAAKAPHKDDQQASWARF
ncbi:hypothetical protein CBR_g26319 [Chara braunii]|uniref:Protein kinase domain-containing protein n=1 Tax=Chara braunii TaxID=69332 RepID=A0A388L7K8_CHABU|nr:hypothetical protein CBR_g26319 [Chara braunii]|eukprot:GBG78289.1 hypothetical protein CBR_g26319 [Chara braunii]